MQDNSLVNKQSNQSAVPPHDIYTIISDAIRAGNFSTVKLLLDNPQHKDIITKKGTNLLANAIYHDHVEIVKYLLEKGCNPNFKTKGRCPSTYIRDRSTPSGKQIYQALIAHGCKKFDVTENITWLLQHFYKIKVAKGVCYGWTTTATFYFSRGEEGFREFNDIFAIFQTDTAENIANKINQAEKARKKFTQKNINNIRQDVKGKFKNYSWKKIYDLFEKSAKNKFHEILDSLLKTKFIDTDEAERSAFIHAIIQYKILGNPLLDLNLKDKIDKLFSETFNSSKKSFEQLIYEAQIEFLVQTKLARKIKKSLGKSAIFLELKPFLQTVAIYQRNVTCLLEENIRKNFISHASIFPYYLLVGSDKNIKRGLIKSHECSVFGKYTIEELTTFFECWREKLQKQEIKNPIHFHLHNYGHQILISYFPKMKKWRYLNNSTFKSFEANETANLAEKVHSSLNDRYIEKMFWLSKFVDSRYSLINSYVYCNPADQKSLQTISQNLQNDAKWNNIHEFKKEKINSFIDKPQIDFLASRCPNINLVEKYVKQRPLDQVPWKTLSLGLLAVGVSIASVFLPWPIGIVVIIPLIVVAVMTIAICSYKIYKNWGYSILEDAKKIKTSEEVIYASNQQHEQHYSSSASVIQKTLKNNNQAIENKSNIADRNADNRHSNFASQEKNDLFTPEHSLFLEIKKRWEIIWSKNSDDGVIDKMLLKSVRKPGFFDISYKVFGYHQFYKEITEILNAKSINYSTDLIFIAQKLSALLNAPLSKANMPYHTYADLKNLHDFMSTQQSSSLRSIPAPPL